ncbi:hypothetical protein BN946_scf184983.g63 [Trametes cinnabarina]|uniref:NAD-dependent epimerase/dehydratase domain-containing protein n=1 Tax=Pycnoporus cinnabarinus TaxID=5643 RepID=A0A060SDY0_PYCCI|nr:hypothetical protein BN946_scf184983.g63 [Trametes cinnabarina]
MPSIAAPAAVLVTGANGFIGQWVVLELLSRGYTVHGTVRTADKVATLSDLVARKSPEGKVRFKGFVVPDITAVRATPAAAPFMTCSAGLSSQDGAFDEAVQGVDGVIHLASPTSIHLEDPQAAIKPAVKGTTSILHSALKARTVKRMVIASSISAIASGSICPPRVYTEEDWNDRAVQVTENEGRNAPGLIKYEASKTLAERAAWEFMEKHRAGVCFDLCVINPSLVFGPMVDDTLPSPDALPVTPAMVYKALFARPSPAECTSACFNCVDVRDITEMFVKALETEEAGGERIVGNAQACTWDDWLLANEHLGLLPGLDRVTQHKAHEPRLPHPFFANDKSKRIFGITYKGVSDTLRDTVADFNVRGWLKHLEG